MHRSVRTTTIRNGKVGPLDAELWAITSYFNPAGYRRRRENYHAFRQRLGVPLVTVEMAHGDAFDLAAGDADVLVQLGGGDVMWQKERLLNIALAAVPPACRKVAWIDADVIFARPDWVEGASVLLDRQPIVQLFARTHYMPADLPTDRFEPGAAELMRPSIAYAVSRGVDPRAGLEEPGALPQSANATGMAWAARRDFVQEHGFYDACIIGGGDRALIAAGYNEPESLIQRHRMHGRRAEHYLAWARRFGKAVAGDIGMLEGDVYHLWHGELARRGALVRNPTLAGFGFDPLGDIAIDADGPWRWASDKPAMHDYLKAYFVSRREDG
jgi:hypothetical protein